MNERYFIKELIRAQKWYSLINENNQKWDEGDDRLDDVFEDFIDKNWNILISTCNQEIIYNLTFQVDKITVIGKFASDSNFRNIVDLSEDSIILYELDEMLLEFIKIVEILKEK